MISGVSLICYILSRTLGFPEAQHDWANPLWTVAMAFEAAFIFLYMSLITGMNVTWPEEREWHD